MDVPGQVPRRRRAGLSPSGIRWAGNRPAGDDREMAPESVRGVEGLDPPSVDVGSADEGGLPQGGQPGFIFSLSRSG